MKPIRSFSGRFAFLSNFHPSPVELDGEVYPTVEHAFQAAKTAVGAEREKIRRAATPHQAKRLGRQCSMRADWDSVRIEIMLDLLRTKFTEPSLREQLQGTGSAELVEGNTWNDRFWGVCRGEGENWLGRLLMQVRDETTPRRMAANE